MDSESLLEHHMSILEDLQYPSGLFAASDPTAPTGYDKSWLRDNFYEALAFERLGHPQVVERTYKALLDALLKHEEKIDWAIKEKPEHKHQYIHARIHPHTFGEFFEEWGNKQNDAVGAILFTAGRLWNTWSIRNADRKRILQKLVDYLGSIEYWHDRDNGMWEMDEEMHASSIGACVAGLKAVSNIQGIDVPEGLIERGEKALEDILPRESKSRAFDLAQLSLIWPYDVVDERQARRILRNVEYHLVREKGVIRFKGDYYYNANEDGESEEAEWTMGLAWLAIIHEKRNQYAKAEHYLQRMIDTRTPRGFPELYYSNSEKHNENTPLGWAQSLFCIALNEIRVEKRARRLSMMEDARSAAAA